MLDSHTQLAIPPETGFVPGCARLSGSGQQLLEEFVNWITTFPVSAPAWPDYGIPIEALRSELQSLEDFTVADGLRGFYRLYALRFGKPRGGDKTPKHALDMTTIQDLLPEARFIHLVRDGRDVALSWRQTWFSPSDDLRTLARAWKDWVDHARTQSSQLRHYVEVQFEQLVAEPEKTLRALTDFIELPYEPGMLAYSARSNERLEEHGTRFSRDGGVLVSRETRLGQVRNTTQPPLATRIFAWKSQLTAEQRAEFASEAGATLEALGYEV